jgi:hypothetical protein
MTIAIKTTKILDIWFGQYIEEKLYDRDNKCWFVTVDRRLKPTIDRLIESGSIEIAKIQTNH